MKSRIFTLFVAIMASATLFAMGRNDGSTKANAIDFNWDNGLIHPGGTLWYRLDLAPMYDRADTLRFSIFNPSNTNSVDVTSRLIILDQAESSTQNLAPQSSFEVWNLDPEILIKVNLTEIFFTVTSSVNVQITWQLTQRTGDSCEEARHGYFQEQDAGTKWYAIYPPSFVEGVNIDSLVVSVGNMDGDSENSISVSFKTDCSSPAFVTKNLTIEPYTIKDVVLPAEFLAALGWPEIVFSCTSTSSCEIFPSYYVSNTGEWCESPKDLAGTTIEHPADIKRWYRLQLYETDIPKNHGIRIHFANLSTEVNNFIADLHYDCNEPKYYTQKGYIAPYEETYIDIDHGILDMLGWSPMLIEYTSDKDTRIWAEWTTLYRDTIFMDTTIYACLGEIIYAGRPVVILNDTTWIDTVSSIINGLDVMDSITRFHVFTLRIPEALSIDEMKTMDAAPTLVQGKPLDVATSNALLTQYYRNMSYQEEYAFIDTVYWAEPVYKADGSLDEYNEASLDLTSPYTSNDLEDTLLLVIMHECDRTCIPYIFPIEETPCNTISGACGNNLTWELSCDSVLTISGTGDMWILTEEQAWKPYKESIKVVILPEGLDSIAPKAFYQCVNLTSVNLPNSVRAVGYAAFYECAKIAEPVYNDRILAYMPFTYTGTYTVPEGIESLASYAFQPSSDGHYATEIVLPSSLKQLGAYSLGWGYQKLTCLATTPPVCDKYGVFSFYFDDVAVIASIDRFTPVYVPAGSLEAYKAADQWKEFFNIQAIPTDPQDANMEVVYIDPSTNEIQREAITLHLPAAPTIEGFTFLKWQVVAGDLEDAIFIQAVYTENDPQFAPAVYTNPANPTQKLIRNGNVYILTGDKVYTITGQAVR